MFFNNHISIVIYTRHINALHSLIAIMTARKLQTNRTRCFSTQWVTHVTPLAAQIHDHKCDIERRAMIINM